MTDSPSHEGNGEKDQVKPFHAKEVASGQEAADVVAAVLKHAAERDEAAKKRSAPRTQPKWMLPLGVNLGVLAVYLLIAPPAWVVVNPIAPPPDEDRLEDLRAGMYIYGMKIEGFRMTNGRLPATLAEVGISVEGIDYTPRGEAAYTLISSVGDETVLFDSSSHTWQEWAQREVGDLSRRIGG